MKVRENADAGHFPKISLHPFLQKKIMSDLSTIEQPQIEPVLSVKLRSWKWWIYGELDPKPVMRTPSYFYPLLLLDLVLWFLLCVHP